MGDITKNDFLNIIQELKATNGTTDFETNYEKFINLRIHHQPLFRNYMQENDVKSAYKHMITSNDRLKDKLMDRFHGGSKKKRRRSRTKRRKLSKKRLSRKKKSKRKKTKRRRKH